MQPQQTSLSQATMEALGFGGLELLEAPQRFVGTLMDSALVDTESPVATNLYHHCNEQYLSRFVAAARECSAESIRVACEAGISYLHDVCGVDEKLASEISLGIAQGLADYLCVSIDFSDIGSSPLLPQPIKLSQKQDQTQFQQTQQSSQSSRSSQTQQPSQSTQTQSQTPPPPPPPRKKPPVAPIAVASVALLVVAALVAYFLLRGPLPSPPPGTVVTISFNANGADEGTIDAISCEAGEQVQLPSGNKLTKDGYTFKGWSKEREGGDSYKSADTFSTSADVTLYAQWELSGSSEPYVVSCDQYSTDGSVVVVLTVQNRAHVTVDLRADFTFNGQSNKTLDTKSDQALSVGPGETTVLESSSDVADIRDVSYKVTSSKPQYSDRSILSCVTMEEVSCNEAGLTILVTNKGDASAVLWCCIAYGKKDTSEFAYVPIQIDADEQELAPGNTRTLVFDGDQWTKLDYDVYLFGFAK